MFGKQGAAEWRWCLRMCFFIYIVKFCYVAVFLIHFISVAVYVYDIKC